MRDKKKETHSAQEIKRKEASHRCVKSSSQVVFRPLHVFISFKAIVYITGNILRVHWAPLHFPSGLLSHLSRFDAWSTQRRQNKRAMINPLGNLACFHNRNHGMCIEFFSARCTPNVDTLRFSHQKPEIQTPKYAFEPFDSQIEVAGDKDRAVRTRMTYAAKSNFCWAWKKPEKKSPYGFQ